MRRAEEPRVCAGCGKSDKDVNGLSLDDDRQLRCYTCAANRRIEVCPLKTTDLSAITRRADRCLTTVTVDWDWQTQIRWLVFGEAKLRGHERNRTHELMAYLNGGMTDFEHDSAYALCLPLIGLQWTSMDYHTSHFVAWVNPNVESDRDFRVPRPGYSPADLPESKMCRRCKPHHIIVPEGYYQPPYDGELYKLVRGKRVEITIGPTPEPETP